MPGLDFHLKDGSKAIDAGIADAASGATDLAGAARTQGAAPDMGAYERAPAVVPAPAPSPTPIGTATPTPTPTPDRTAPKLTKLKATSSTVTFTLSEGATVTVTFGLKRTGKKHGKTCVKPTAKLKKAKPCTRLVTKATVKKTFAAGAAKLRLTKKLTKGSYTVSAVAVDVASNKANAVTASLKVR